MATSLQLDPTMKERTITIPEIMLIAGTRVALGAGIGLLLSDRLKGDQRRGAGWALLAVGVLSSIPIAADILAKTPARKPTIIAA
jgi:hypothetical protein